MSIAATTDLLALLRRFFSYFNSFMNMRHVSRIWLNEFKKRKEKGWLEDLQKCYYEDVSIDEQGRDDEGRNLEEYLMVYEPDGNTLDDLVRDIRAFVSKVGVFITGDPLLSQIFVTAEENTALFFRDGLGKLNLGTLFTLYSRIVDAKHPSMESYATWLLGRFHKMEEEKKGFNREMDFYEYLYYYLWVHKRSARKNIEGDDLTGYDFDFALTMLRNKHNFPSSFES